MATRTIYVPETSFDLWDLFIEQAKKENVPMSTLVEKAMQEYLFQKRSKCTKCERIAQILKER